MNVLKNFTSVLWVLFTVQLFSQTCGDYSTSDYQEIFQKIADAQRLGNDSDATVLIDKAKTMVINDLFYLVNESIPSAQGQFCKPNDVTNYMNCLQNLTNKGEFLGVDAVITDKARQRYKEAVDHWTTELVNSSVPFSAKPCEDYLACLFKAQTDREIAGVAKNAIDAKIQEKIDDILLKGCEPCSTKWMIIASVSISFETSDINGTRLATLKGKATWDRVDIILDVNKYQDKCNMMGLSLDKTLPTIRHISPGLPKANLELIDGDKDFAKEMIDATIDVDVEATYLLNTIELNAYLGFSDVGEQVTIPIKDKLFNLEKRLPFSVSETVTNEEIPTYRADFRFYFTPVFDD